jgi:hypothetical protein
MNQGNSHGAMSALIQGMRIIILCITATYTLTGCREEKNSAANPTPPPAAPPTASAPAQPTQKNTNLLKAPIDRTRSVLDQVRKGNAGNGE